MARDAADDDRFVTLTEVYDPTQAQMIRDLLEQEGIPTLVPGVEHRGMLGMMGAFIALPVQVPERLAERAREIVEALDHPDAEIAPGEQVPSARQPPPEGSEEGPGGPYRAGTAAAPVDRPKLKRVAAFVSIALTAGMGHMYARAYRGGFVLLLSEVLLFVLVGAGAERAGLGLLVVIAVDLFGSMRAVERFNTARHPTRGDRVWMLAPALVPFVVLGLAASWIEMRLWPVESVAEETAEVCALHAKCKGGAPQECIDWTRERLRESKHRPEWLLACSECLSGSRYCGTLERCETQCVLPSIGAAPGPLEPFSPRAPLRRPPPLPRPSLPSRP